MHSATTILSMHHYYMQQFFNVRYLSTYNYSRFQLLVCLFQVLMHTLLILKQH